MYSQAIPAKKPVNPDRAPLDKPGSRIGDLTEPEVILTIGSNFLLTIESITAFIILIDVNMFSLIALIQSSLSQFFNDQEVPPPELLTRI